MNDRTLVGKLSAGKMIPEICNTHSAAECQIPDGVEGFVDVPTYNDLRSIVPKEDKDSVDIAWVQDRGKGQGF